MGDIITFYVSRRRRKMYCGHARLCVCVSVRGRTPHLSGRRLDVYHTLAHGVALVPI